MSDDKTEIQEAAVEIGSPHLQDRKLIVKLALDCKTWNLEWEVGKKYMEKFLGREISRSTYYNYLDILDTEKELKVWIEEQARTGFVKNQRDMIEETIRLKELVSKQLQDEIAKPDTKDVVYITKQGPKEYEDQPNPNKSKAYILGLMNQMNNLNKRLEELNMSNPVIATIKLMIEQTKQPERKLLVPTTTSL